MAVSHVFSSPVADFTGTVTVFDSNGQTATTNATALVRPSNWNSVHNQFMTISGNTAGASTASGTNLVLQGGNNVTLSVTDQTIIFSASQSQSVQTQNMVSVLGSTGNISFANGNGVTFGGNASTITASHNGLTSQSNQAFSAPGGSSAFQTLVFANSQGVSWSNSNGSVVASVATNYAASDHSHGNPTLALTNLSGTTASNSAGLTLSLSAAAPGAVTLTNYATGNTTQSSSGTIAGSSVIVNGAGGISAGISNGSIVVSGPDLTSLAATGALSASSNGSTISLGVGTVTMSATGNTTQNSSGTVNLNGLIIQGTGGVSAGLSNGSIVISGGAGGFTGGISGGNTSGDTGTVSNRIVFAGGNNVTVSGSTNAGGMSVTISGANAGGAQTGISGIIVSDTTYTSGTVSFSNANGISFGSSAGQAITASYTIPTQTNQTGGIYFTAQTTGQSSSSTYDLRTLSVVGDGIVSAGWSNGTVRISATQSNQAFSAGAASSTFQTLTFQDSNGLSFSNNGGAIRVSYTTPVVSNAIQSVGSATGSGTNTSRFAADDHVHAGVFSMGVSTGGNTAGDTRVDVGRFVLVGGNNITLSQGTAAGALNTITISAGAGGGGFTGGMSNIGNTAGTTGTVQSQMIVVGGPNITVSQSINGNSATLSISGNAPGAAAENNHINLLGANTAGNTTASGSTIGLSGLNLTLSGTNASQIVFSAPATSSLVGASGISVSTNGSTITVYMNPMSGFNPYADIEKLAGQYGQATLQFDPVRAPNFVMDRILIPVINTNSSNSSGSHTLSFWVGLYSKNESTLSAVFTASASTALTHSGTAGSYSLYSGNRLFTIAASQTITEGDYWIGFVSRTTSGGTNGSYSNLVASNIASNFLGFFGSSNNTTQQLTLGQGVYTASTSGMPSSVAFSQIRGSDSQARRAAFIMFGYSTV